MMKKYFKIVCLITCFLPLLAIAQVGINNPSPHASAVLDLSGGANAGKGLLLPQTNNLVGIASPARGLLVLDSATNEVYIHNVDSLKWYSVNPWRKEFLSPIIKTDREVEISYKLTIGESNFAILAGDHVMEVNGGVLFKGDPLKGFKVEADTTLGQVAGFEGHGAVPPMTIMMWAGPVGSVPYGWGLCDGSFYYANGSKMTGFVTVDASKITNFSKSGVMVTKSPDLRGRFIVGYDPADADYNNYGKQGPSYTDADGTSTGNNTQDAKDIKLTTGQMPAHFHIGGLGGNNAAAFDYGVTTVGSTLAAGVTGSGSNPHTSTEGNDEAHENRPPYYTMVFIIKCAWVNEYPGQ